MADFLREHGFPGRRLHVIPSGIDVRRTEPSEARDPYVLGTAAVPASLEGHGRAPRRLCARDASPPTGDLRERRVARADARSRAARLGVSATFHGEIADAPRAAIEALDGFVLPSRAENLPVSLLWRRWPARCPSSPPASAASRSSSRTASTAWPVPAEDPGSPRRRDRPAHSIADPAAPRPARPSRSRDRSTDDLRSRPPRSQRRLAQPLHANSTRARLQRRESQHLTMRDPAGDPGAAGRWAPSASSSRLRKGAPRWPGHDVRRRRGGRAARRRGRRSPHYPAPAPRAPPLADLPQRRPRARSRHSAGWRPTILPLPQPRRRRGRRARDSCEAAAFPPVVTVHGVPEEDYDLTRRAVLKGSGGFDVVARAAPASPRRSSQRGVRVRRDDRQRRRHRRLPPAGPRGARDWSSHSTQRSPLLVTGGPPRRARGAGPRDPGARADPRRVSARGGRGTAPRRA